MYLLCPGRYRGSKIHGFIPGRSRGSRFHGLSRWLRLQRTTLSGETNHETDPSLGNERPLLPNWCPKTSHIANYPQSLLDLGSLTQDSRGHPDQEQELLLQYIAFLVWPFLVLFLTLPLFCCQSADNGSSIFPLSILDFPLDFPLVVPWVLITEAETRTFGSSRSIGFMSRPPLTYREVQTSDTSSCVQNTSSNSLTKASCRVSASVAQ